MDITFSLGHVFNDQASPLENARVLKIMLDALIKVNLVYLRHHPRTPKLFSRKAGVVYGRTVVSDPIPELYKRGYGDCKSLSAARIAELLIVGIKAKPVFRFKKSDDTMNYHILVQTAAGWEDPSKVLGMGRNENEWFYDEVQ